MRTGPVFTLQVASALNLYRTFPRIFLRLQDCNHPIISSSQYFENKCGDTPSIPVVHTPRNSKKTTTSAAVTNQLSFEPQAQYLSLKKERVNGMSPQDKNCSLNQESLKSWRNWHSFLPESLLLLYSTPKHYLQIGSCQQCEKQHGIRKDTESLACNSIWSLTKCRSQATK